MHPKQNARRPLLWGLTLAAGLIGTTAFGQPMQPDPTKVSDVQIDPKTGALIVPLGGVVRFDPKAPTPIVDVVVSREDVLGVRPDPGNPKLLLLTGRSPGLTKLTVTPKDSPKLVFDVIVQPDFELLRALIRRTVPTANVEVTPGLGNVVILSGYVTSPQDADIIARLANSQVGGNNANVINAIQIGGVQQVEIQVVVASVDRSEVRNRGTDFVVSGTTFQLNSIVSGLISPPPLGGLGTQTGTISPIANIQFGVVPAQFFAALQV